MGLFDKIKAAKNALTGGAAKVYVDLQGQVTPGQEMPVTVRVSAEQDLKFSSIYLLIRATESASVEDRDYDEDEGVDHETVHDTHTSHDVRVEIAGAGQMSAGQEQSFRGSFTLPTSVQPTFRGYIADHIWRIQAGVDAFGNDPDSGWHEFAVR
jgi:hypothetical protein